MDKIEWGTFFTDSLTGIVVLIIGLILGGITGYFQGKKKSSLGIERKNEIYQPLLDELLPMSRSELSVLVKKETPMLKEIFMNDYKYGLSTELQKKCDHLYSLVEKHNQINIVLIAHKKIVEIFEKGYEELYGSIIEGVSIHTDRDGNGYEQEHEVLPVELIRRGNFEKEIISLLNNEGMYDSEVCVDKSNNYFVPIYSVLVRIYNAVLLTKMNGEENILPPLKKELNMSPAEYIALHYNFFEIFNSDIQITKKIELEEEIIDKSQELISDLKGIIKKIVKTYEVEEI
ncbi:hypothetical protein [Solibacillus sp. FSL K6-1554]|uniref:hypothetical protein n=1 Tax=Solibacillus sp. FSL K6-1554 TaxID=2921472 RepID=UPI0030FB0F85